MGGGIATAIAIQHPNLFAGLILVCPMLFLSDEMKPRKIVTDFLQNVLAPLVPTWPITPSKNTNLFAYRDPEQCQKYVQNPDPLGMHGLKPRVATAVAMAITWPDWLTKHMCRLTTPLFLLHGDSDRVCDPVLSKRLYDAANISDKTLKYIEGAHHLELLSCTPGRGERTVLAIPGTDQGGKLENRTLRIKKK